MPNTLFLSRLFLLAPQDRRFRERLGNRQRATIDTLQATLLGQDFQVAPGGSLADLELVNNIGYAKPAFTL